MRPTERDAGRVVDLGDATAADFLESAPVTVLAILEPDDEVSLRVRHRLGLVCARTGAPAGVVPLESRVAEAFGARSAPMILVFAAGEVVDRLIGAPPEEILEETVRARMR